MSSIFGLKDFGVRLRERIQSWGETWKQKEQPPEKDFPFASLATELFALQFQRNLPYRKFCLGRGVSPGALQCWNEIPALPTAAFKEASVSCLEPAERTTVFYSSGTTAQQPSRHFHNKESLSLYEASLWSWFKVRFLSPSGPSAPASSLISLTPSPIAAPHSSLAHMFGALSRRPVWSESRFLGQVEGDGSWALDLEQTVLALEASARAGKPVLLCGTAFLFVHLLDYLTEHLRSVELPEGSRVMETGGYKGRSRSLPKEELHAGLAERLAISPEQIFSEYGMSELSSQAYNRGPTHDAPGRFQFPPWARAQLISPETGREVDDGQTGLIRVFDLANVYSAMAVQTEDLGVRTGEGFELLGRAAFAEPRGCSLLSV